MEEVLEEEKLSDNATEQKKRDFMKQMRNLDAKMFNYPKSSDYNSYSQSCPAVDDRQPIILSTAQYKNRKENPEWIDENSRMILEWGSNKENKKYYICTRLFCVKCMMPLVMKQLLPDKSTGKPRERVHSVKVLLLKMIQLLTKILLL